MIKLKVKKVEINPIIWGILLFLILFIAPKTWATTEIILSDNKPIPPEFVARLTPKEKIWLQTNKKIRAAMKSGWMPIAFTLENEQHQGVSVDYLSKISQLLNINIEVVNYSENMSPAQVDIIASVPNKIGLSDSDFMIVKQPFISSKYAIYVKNNSRFKAADGSLSDFQGYKVAVFKNAPVVKIIQENYPKVDFIKTDIADDAFEALRLGQVDAYVGNQIIIDYHIGVHHLSFVKKLGLTPFKTDIFMATRNDSPELNSIFEKAIEYIGTNNKEVMEKWQIDNSPKNYLVWYLIAGFFTVTFIVVSRLFKLSLTIKRQSAETSQKIWYQANFDSLTGLPNRQMFYDRLALEIKKSHRSQKPIALMFIDLDHFKDVNDSLGHDQGDQLLKEVGARLKTCVRDTDTIARLGGDEFAVIMGELDESANVERVAEDILQELSTSYQLGNNKAYVSGSIGITFYPADAESIDALLKNADQAMYASKNQGRNCYNYFTRSMQEDLRIRTQLATDLRIALAKKQFWLAYQPIVELKDGRIYKAEALIRWQHPEFGLIPPSEFIRIAEESGLIVDVGNWVFREAAQQAKLWRASVHPDFQISVNKSPVQFKADNETLHSWPHYMQELDLPGESIVVEITESLLLDVSSMITQRLLEFRDAGIQVAIDDFGTGYSALSYIKKFDIDFLKIDQIFTRNLKPGSDDMALCEAIIVMAHKLGIKVIAEGVETEEQKVLLLKAGCDYGQGYLWSKPVSAKEFEALT